MQQPSQHRPADPDPHGSATPDPAAAALEPTSPEQYRAWRERALPPTEQVAPGLWAVPVPLPTPGLRYVTVYLLELAGGGVALVDAGWDTPEAWDALQQGLAAAGATPGDVRAVLVTHIHPDHYGLAGRVREASGAWVALHPADAALLQLRYEDVDPLIKQVNAALEAWGVPLEEAELLGSASVMARAWVRTAKPDVLLEDGDRPQLAGWQLRTVWTPGHSPGHVCFYDPERRLLLSGDHVLPHTSPNVSVHPQQRPDPLGDYLAGLETLARLDVAEVLPAHEYRFRRLDRRVAALREHHARRLEELVAALRERPGQTVWELTQAATWSRPLEEFPPFLRRAAAGETLAHLTRLERAGRVRAEGDRPIRWYAQAGAG